MERNKLRGDYSEIIGDSPQILEVLQQIKNFAAAPIGIPISGETGIGKGVVARVLLKNSGRPGEMVSVTSADTRHIYADGGESTADAENPAISVFRKL